jgi:hypothetical protein
MVDQAAHFVALGTAIGTSTGALGWSADNVIICIEQAIYKR